VIPPLWPQFFLFFLCSLSLFRSLTVFFFSPLLATTPSPFIRPKSVVTAGLLNAL
jgi:hypothetical protein